MDTSISLLGHVGSLASGAMLREHAFIPYSDSDSRKAANRRTREQFSTHTHSRTLPSFTAALVHDQALAVGGFVAHQLLPSAVAVNAFQILLLTI